MVETLTYCRIIFNNKNRKMAKDRMGLAQRAPVDRQVGLIEIERKITH
jgi:hypothetical protein